MPDHEMQKVYGRTAMTAGRAGNPSKCIEVVWRNRGWHCGQCTRKRGHGPKGAYCKQHAKQYEAPTK